MANFLMVIGFHILIGAYKVLKYTVPVVLALFFYALVDGDMEDPDEKAWNLFGGCFALAISTGAAFGFFRYVNSVENKIWTNSYIKYSLCFLFTIAFYCIGSLIAGWLFPLEDWIFNPIETYTTTLLFSSAAFVIGWFLNNDAEDKEKSEQPNNANHEKDNE